MLGKMSFSLSPQDAMVDPVHDLTAYTYRALEGPRSFRLLRLLPTPEDSPYINCAIEHFDRGSEHCPPYTALSYAWGDNRTTASITLNGQLAFITENLHEALLHLRRVRPYTLHWVDALCINQDDQSERGHQVAQMRAIYSEASNVITWLGQGTKDTGRFFIFMRQHHYACTMQDASIEDCGFLFDHGLADALHHIGLRPYWDRIWVTQEIVVATNLEIMCGDESVPWNIFTKFLDLSRHGHFKKVTGLNRSLKLFLYSTLDQITTSWRRTSISLSYAIGRTSISRATDSRDRVYALLGLVDRGAGQHITVDYTIAPCIVFLIATQAIIRDWNEGGNTRREQNLQEMLSKINTEPTSRQRFKNYYAGSRASPIPECRAVASLREYVRFMLGDSDYLDIDETTGDGDRPSCDGEKCGSWAAMYGAAMMVWAFTEPSQE
jgi:hypothetical protein